MNFETWFSTHVRCSTCRNAIDQDLFGQVYCQHPELPDFGWIDAGASCECHDFADPELAAEQQRWLEEWYQSEYGHIESANPFTEPEPGTIPHHPT